MKSSTTRKRIRIGLAVFWLGIVGWLFVNMQAHGLPDDILESDTVVRVTIGDDRIEFSPAVDSMEVGLIFYPGALVEPSAYAPLAWSVAEAGYPAVIVFVPLRLAPFQRHRDELALRTRGVIEAREGRKWIVGGHSKGGALAAVLARELASEIDGLLLVGTSHPRREDLSGLVLDVTKVFGSEDGLASVDEIKEFSSNLPPSTTYVLIDGANHSQFGYYGWQPGAGRALISREDQQRQTLLPILTQLRRISDG